jgi:hypothetical protein
MESFGANYRNAAWYIEDVNIHRGHGSQLGFKKVSQMKLAVAKGIRDFDAGAVTCCP